MAKYKWSNEEFTAIYWYYFKYQNEETNLRDRDTTHMQELINLFRKINSKRPEDQTYSTIQKRIDEIVNYVNDNPKNSFKLKTKALEIFKSYENNLNQLNIDYQKIIKKYRNINDETASNLIPERNKYEWQNRKEIDIHPEDWELKIILNKIDKKRLLVPIFQRDFVWTKKDIISFLNSLVQRNLFGTLYLWRDDNKKLINEKNPFFPIIDKNKVKDDIEFIVDGQQRLTSIYGLKNINQDNNWKKKFSRIVYSFIDDEFDDEAVIKNRDYPYVHAKNIFFPPEKNNELNIVSSNIIKDEDKKKIVDRCREIRENVGDMQIPIVYIKQATFEEVSDIFSDINTKGTKLDLFDLVYSKWITYDKSFDLKKYDNLEWQPTTKKFKIQDTHTYLSGDDFIKCLYIQLEDKNISDIPLISRKDILRADPTDLIKEFSFYFDNIIWSIRHVERFFQYHVPSINLIRIATYFRKLCEDKAKKNKNANFHKATKALKQYLINASINNRYEKSTTTAIKKDLKNIKNMVEKDLFEYDDEFQFTINNLDKINFVHNAKQNTMCFYLFLNALDANELRYGTMHKGKEKTELHHIIPRSLDYQMNTGETKKIDDHKWGNTVLNFAPIVKKEHKIMKNMPPAEYLLYFDKDPESLEKDLKALCIDYNLLKQVKKHENEKLSINEIEQFWNKRKEDLINKARERIEKYINNIL